MKQIDLQKVVTVSSQLLSGSRITILKVSVALLFFAKKLRIADATVVSRALVILSDFNLALELPSSKASLSILGCCKIRDGVWISSFVVFHLRNTIVWFANLLSIRKTTGA